MLNAQLSKRNQAAVKRKQIRRAWTKEDLRNDAQLAAVECPLRERNVVALGSFELVSTIPKLATITHLLSGRYRTTVLSGLRKHLVGRVQFGSSSDVSRRTKTPHCRCKQRQASVREKLGSIDRQIGRPTDAMIASDAPVTQFTSKISKLNAERQELKANFKT